MLVPQGTFDSLLNYPDYIGAKSPLFSMTSVDPSDGFPSGKIADLGADGQTFAMEDSYYPDYDFNDLIFRIEGAEGTAVSVEEVMAADQDWRMDESVQELVKEIVEPVDLAGNTPDEAQNAFPTTAGRIYRGYLDSEDTEDYHIFSLGMSNELTFSLDGLRGDANIEVLDLDNQVVFSSTNIGTVAESVSGIIEAGTYRLRVHSVDGISTAYRLNLSVTPTIEGITTTALGSPVYLHTTQSLPLINVDDFRSGNASRGSRPEFAGIDGTGFSTVIIDTGIDLDHPFFGADNNSDGVSDRIVFHFDFADGDNIGQDLVNTEADSGHGSRVASIAASGDAINPGVARNANIIALKVFTRDGNDADNRADGNNAWTEQALQWVVANAEAFNIASVNMSLGGGNFQTPQSQDPYSDELATLASLNVIVTASAGNNYFRLADANNNQQIDFGEQFTTGVAYPAADPNTIAVGAVFDADVGPYQDGTGATANTTGADRIAPFSQRHPVLTDIFAPGPFTTVANAVGGISQVFGGTSAAAPHIAGMAVLSQQLAQQELSRLLTPTEFRQMLQNTGTPIFDGDDEDGDDEDDNVVNTQQTYRRADMLSLANAIMDLRPPNNLDIDLFGAGFDVVQEPLNPGNLFNVNFTVRNNGFDNAGGFNVNFYLSENPTITQLDYFLGTSFINGVPANGTIGGGQLLRLPTGNDPFWFDAFGNLSSDKLYYVGMFVDANNVIGETNDNNNRSTVFGADFEDVFITHPRFVTVQVNRVKGDFDRGKRGGVLELRRGRSDFYTLLSVDNETWVSPTKVNDNDYEPPDWRFTKFTTNPNVPITIRLYDQDRGLFNDDDKVDIDFRPGDKDLHLNYNWITGQITGDLFGFQGQQIYARGGGASSVGEIWFTINSFV